jgi:diacylglycerol kinase family enzyme
LFLNRSSGASDAEPLRLAATEQGLEVIDLAPEVDVAREIRDRLGRGIRLFVAAGGDGTVHHVVQALVYSEAVFAIIPTGTFNHFARDIGVPLDWPEALDVALHGESVPIDAGRVNDRFFVNNVSIGLYPELLRTEARGRGYSRWRARLIAFYRTLRKYPHVTLAIESDYHQQLIRTHVFMVSNNQYDLDRVGIGAPRATLAGGQLAVYWLPHTSRLRLMRFVTRYVRGRVREIPGFRSFRTRRMRVQSSRPTLHLGIDGELFTLATPLVITIAAQSLVVRVPRL